MPVAWSIREGGREGGRELGRLSRRDATVRAIALAWRRLTGGTGRGRLVGCRRTVLACSGGADSSGLVLALASAIPGARGLLVVGHVVHDLRPGEEALADRDAAAALAGALGLEFAQADISVREAGGNLEAAARRLRYAALARLADEHECPYLATAHHADDQLETVVMGLLRGAGPRGLRGAAAKRRLAGHATLIRPALVLRRADLQRLCTDAGWAWREDATNADLSRLRAAVRRRILPVLEELRPGAAERSARSAGLIADAAAVVDDRVRLLLAQSHTADGRLAWPRATLQPERAVVLGGLLRAAAARLRRGRGRDRLGSRTLAPVIRAIRDRVTDPRRFVLSGIEIEVTARHVRLETGNE